MAVTDVTNLVERLEAFEDRLKVRLEGLSASIDNYDGDESCWLDVLGELHSQDGTTLQQAVKLVVDVQDSSSRLVATEDHYISPAKFFGFETFKILIQMPADLAGSIRRIRVYPKAD